MAGHSRKVDDSLRIHSLQLLTSRRFDLYGTLTPLLAALEDAIAQRSVRKIIETYAEIRRFLRESLAFLNRPIYEALQGMEEAMEAGADSVGGIDLDRLRLEMVRLHVEFARAIREPAFEPVEDVLGLSIATRIRLRERPPLPVPSADQDVMAQALEQCRSGWAHLKAKRYRPGVKHFRRAVALLPGVPKFRADLALALHLAGEAREAVIQATAALQGYAADLTGDAGERREARRTLGRSLRAVAEEKFGQRQLDEAVREMRKASREMEDSLVEEPEGPVMADVRSEIREIRERLGQWEQIWKRVSGVSKVPEETSPRDTPD